jgi:septum formation protein
MKIILASASPRRAELLRQIGVSFQQLPVDIDEALKPDETPVDHVARLAREKACAGAELALQHEIHLPVLGADTIIELDGEVMGKPVNAEHARTMLQTLSGKTHHVHTAVCLICGEMQIQALSSSRVEFARLCPAEIEHYVASGEPLGKAGAYAIQGAAAQFIKLLHGSYSGVMGLPLYETAELLKSCETRRSS